LQLQQVINRQLRMHQQLTSPQVKNPPRALLLQQHRKVHQLVTRQLHLLVEHHSVNSDVVC
jgi:hypothetical protein